LNKAKEVKSRFHFAERFAIAWISPPHLPPDSHSGNTRMTHLALNVRISLLTTAVAAGSLCFMADAQATDPVAPPDDKPVSLSVAPVHVYRPPSVVGTSEPASEPTPASGADDQSSRPTPSLEKPDNWACRTSNYLSRSSAGRNPDGKSTFDIERLLPKC
jgi:hypothetical protein